MGPRLDTSMKGHPRADGEFALVTHKTMAAIMPR
jgi:hypothetical protein